MIMKITTSNTSSPTNEKNTAGSECIDNMVGALIREKRQELAMSLKELSEASGLSIGLLSQVERGLSSPSVRTLSLISTELGVTPSWFFGHSEAQQESSIVLRKAQRQSVDYAEGITKQILTHVGMPGLELLLVQMDGHASSGDDFYSHPGEEAGYVLTGSLRLYVQDDVFLLREGDTFKFKSTIPHRFENPGKSESQVLWILTAPSYV